MGVNLKANGQISLQSILKTELNLHANETHIASVISVKTFHKSFQYTEFNRLIDKGNGCGHPARNTKHVRSGEYLSVLIA